MKVNIIKQEKKSLNFKELLLKFYNVVEIKLYIKINSLPKNLYIYRKEREKNILLKALTFQCILSL